MTDLVGNSDEISTIETLSGASKQPSELDVEGKRFGQALLADQSFIQAISTAVMSGLSMNTGTPHGSVNQTELTATKWPASEFYGPREMEILLTPLLSLCKLSISNLIFPLKGKSILLSLMALTMIWLFRTNLLTL